MLSLHKQVFGWKCVSFLVPDGTNCSSEHRGAASVVLRHMRHSKVGHERGEELGEGEGERERERKEE